MDLSNRNAFVGSGMIAGICLAIGSIAGLPGVILGMGAFLFFGVWFLWLELSGPDLVEVRFAVDESPIGFWDRMFIKRTVNQCYVYLKALGLEPPRVSPVIRVASFPVALTPGSTGVLSSLGTACICSASSAPDTSGFMYQRPYHKATIASAYMFCYIFRFFGGGSGRVMDELTSADAHFMDEYFSYAFSDVPFTYPGKDGSATSWISALVNIRHTCGKEFTDMAMAYTLHLLVSAKRKEGESFSEWIYKSLSTGMLNTVSNSNRDKIAEVVGILLERKLVNEEFVRRDLMGI